MMKFVSPDCPVVWHRNVTHNLSHFMNRLVIMLAILTLPAYLGFSQETMTPERFRELAATPGDLAPLEPQLSSVPFWTSAVESNVITYASGKVFKEETSVNARTVAGKYIICTFYSKLYRQTVNTVLTFDEKASAIKGYGLFSDSRGRNTLAKAQSPMTTLKKRTPCSHHMEMDSKKRLLVLILL